MLIFFFFFQFSAVNVLYTHDEQLHTHKNFLCFFPSTDNYKLVTSFYQKYKIFIVYLQMVQNLMIEREFAINDKFQIAMYLS